MNKISNISRILALVVLAVSLAMGVSSCGSSKMASGKAKRTQVTTSGNKKSDRKTSKPAPVKHIDVAAATKNPITKTLLKEADSWIGTPYVWGGNDRKGVDCSGFVTQVYLKALEISLPRTSEKQMQYCSPIDKKDLLPGDLVFFTVRGGDRVGHVGIYIGNGNMVHSSSSKGVVITPLSTPYFVTNYHSAGRIERYVAMVEKHGKKAPVPEKVAPTKNEPMLASKTASKIEKPKASSKIQEPKNEVKASKKPQKAAKEQKKTLKPEPVSVPSPEFTTPLPSQVFASKGDVEVETDGEEIEMESPDFFD
ncbi:MAG: C40 family peptidase [Firmicutes bacterium]|nr:C40 family peptidase [Bacillota bacterium]MCM1401814.1 C40 family peptidase [Bacteroides sp.]MCM1477698.1 C40 family peptidase [Bacteroides sp.]